MLNSRENLKIHPRSGETHAGLERRREGQAQIDGCFAGPGLRLPSGQLALRPRSRPAGVQPQPLYQHLWGPPRAVPAGTRSSRPGFLGDCCQVRNSKAEFIILADNWRCSSPELLPDRAPARCQREPPREGCARGTGAARPLASLPGRRHVFWGYFCLLECCRQGKEAKPPQGPRRSADGRGLAGCPALASLDPVSMCPSQHRAHREPPAWDPQREEQSRGGRQWQGWGACTWGMTACKGKQRAAQSYKSCL